MRRATERSLLSALAASLLVTLSQSCGDPSKGVPVLGGEVSGVMWGIDFVALSTYNPATTPWTYVWANGTYKDNSLGGYNFYFQTEANLKVLYCLAVPTHWCLPRRSRPTRPSSRPRSVATEPGDSPALISTEGHLVVFGMAALRGRTATTPISVPAPTKTKPISTWQQAQRRKWRRRGMLHTATRRRTSTQLLNHPDTMGTASTLISLLKYPIQIS